MPAGVAGALAVAALAWLAGGVALTRRGARASGALLVGAGGTLLLAALVGRGSGAEVFDRSGWLVLVAAEVALPALACFPRPGRTPVDLLTLAVLLLVPVLTLAAGTQAPPSGRVLAVRFNSAILAGTALGAHAWWRLERAGAVDRRALLWCMTPTAAVLLLAGLVAFVAPNPAGALVLSASAAVVPAGPWLGLARPQVLDPRGLGARLLVLLGTFISTLAVFQVARFSVEGLLGRPLVPGPLAALAALTGFAVNPVRVGLRAVVDDVLFGGRPDPLRAASRLAASVPDDPAAALALVREALVLPYAEIRVDGRTVTSSGTRDGATSAVPLASSTGTGELVVGLRPGELRLGKADAQVLRLVAPLLAQALQAGAEAAQVRTSRESTVRAVAEERRRLRRDLHDGLGPRLSGIGFTADAARNVLRADADRAEDLLTVLRAEVAGAVADIRRLVYDMRPPALDELGLVGALQRYATGLGPAVELVAEHVPPLPAAWEVAAYRIAVSALDNSSRHGVATRIALTLVAVDGDLVVTVTDDGGDVEGWTPGVGVTAMHERAAELGGTLSAGPVPGGWQVRAVLPLPRPARPTDP